MVSLDGMALEPEHGRIGELVEAAMEAGDYLFPLFTVKP
jgi:hypothetical protein